MTLEWVVASALHCQPAQRLNEAEVELAKALWKLLHQLVILPLDDLTLHMVHIPSFVLLCALHCVDQPDLQGFSPFTQLLSAVLRRIARDRTQCEPEPGTDPVAANQKFMFLWHFVGMSSSKIMSNTHHLCNAFCLPGPA